MFVSGSKIDIYKIGETHGYDPEFNETIISDGEDAETITKLIAINVHTVLNKIEYIVASGYLRNNEKHFNNIFHAIEYYNSI